MMQFVMSQDKTSITPPEAGLQQEHSQQGYSSLYKHSSDLCHQIDYSNPAVISVDNNDYRLQIKEALKIKDLKAYNSLNANIRSCELKLW